jgi:hypothetical protein
MTARHQADRRGQPTKSASDDHDSTTHRSSSRQPVIPHGCFR